MAGVVLVMAAVAVDCAGRGVRSGKIPAPPSPVLQLNVATNDAPWVIGEHASFWLVFTNLAPAPAEICVLEGQTEWSVIAVPFEPRQGRMPAYFHPPSWVDVAHRTDGIRFPGPCERKVRLGPTESAIWPLGFNVPDIGEGAAQLWLSIEVEDISKPHWPHFLVSAPPVPIQLRRPPQQKLPH